MAKTKDCDCYHFPWQPAKCFQECGGLLVSTASDDYLTAVVKLTPEVVQKIATRKSGPWQSLDDLARILSDDELLEVITRFREYSEMRAEQQAPMLEAVVAETLEAEESYHQDERVKEH
jgi:hypothetical protein